MEKSKWLVLPVQKVLHMGFGSRSLIQCFCVTYVDIDSNGINSLFVYICIREFLILIFS